MYEKIWRVIDGSFIGRRGDSVVSVKYNMR